MTTLTGRFGAALEALATTLADTPEFRVWTTGGTYDPDASRTPEEETAAHDAAYEFVHFYTQRDEGWVRPAVLIAFDDDYIIGKNAATCFNLWADGNIKMMFEAESSLSNVTAPHDGNKAFMDDVLGIVDGMITLIEGDTEGKYFQASQVAPGDVAVSDVKQGDAGNYIQWHWKIGR